MDAMQQGLQCTPVQKCPQKNKDWIGVRVIDESGKAVKDIKVKMKLTDGSVVTIDFASTALDGDGSYKTARTIDPGDCEISFPDTYDIEWKPQ